MSDRRTYTPEEIRAGNANLLKLAEILETADAEHQAKGEPPYDQSTYAHHCGTPACAVGHWRAFRGRIVVPAQAPHHQSAQVDRDDFALVDMEYYGLFGDFGCGDAQTAKEAAAFIRTFVDNREEYPVLLTKIDAEGNLPS
jgi:hypothetical protein